MRATRREFIGLAAGALAVGLVGCGSSQPAEPEDLEIKESGWTVDENGYVYYAIGITNPNEGYVASYPSYTITGRAEDDSVVFSDEQVLMAILPGETTYYGFQAGNGTAPAKVEFEITDCEWVEHEPMEESPFEVTNTAEVAGAYSTSFTGEVVLNDASVVEEITATDQVALTLVLRDDADEIVYGTSTFVDLPSEGQSMPFEIDTWSTLPAYAAFEVHPNIW